MLEGFFYAQKKLPIISFSYIVPIRKDNKKMTRKEYITFAKFHGDFIFDLYNQTKIKPSDIIYIDRLLKNHLISIFKTDNSRFDIGRYKDFIIDYLKKEYDFEVAELQSVLM
jgi:hypothetical protein